MGMLWTNNDARNRATRLVVKVGSSPFLPVLAIGKVVESLIAGGPTMAWLTAALAASAWFVVAEDFVEAFGDTVDEIDDYINNNG
jgi:hypothetical protein